MSNTSETKSQFTQDQIAAKAYQLWEADGRPDGRDVEYWLKAQERLSKDGKPQDATLRRDTTPLAAAPKAPENDRKKKSSNANGNGAKKQPAFA
ncbi:MAG TPA: DUF2934 domain-containing protein [Verrucomicrobiae bacterium]|jgi:hypothetical protein|nr:DUF2934 domain-containing protein [Verrucomicrobiae bacterium]